MAVATFGVTAADVASIHFPQWNGGFNANTKPTSTAVTTQISRLGAKLNAKLYAENVIASSLAADTVPYLMCAEQLAKMVAAWALTKATQQNPELAKAMQDEVDAWFEQLDEKGATHLGDSTLDSSTAPANGPTTHLNTFSLTVDSADDMSSAVPLLRKDDNP